MRRKSVRTLSFSVGFTMSIIGQVMTAEPNVNRESREAVVLIDSPRLAAVYGQGVVVLTNAVMSADTRKKVEVPSEEWRRYRLEELEASQNGGAKVKATLHVVNLDGSSIPQAAIDINLALNGARPVRGMTDGEGLFTAEGKLQEELIYCVSKEGYYRTRSKFLFRDLGIISIQNGRWLPWNPTFRVTLKDVRHPVPLCARRFEAAMPADTNSLGFDFIAGDWVSPYGKGAHADMVYTFSENRKDRANYDLSITLSFPGESNGFYMRKKDQYSDLISDHQAAPSGYRPERSFRLQRVNGKYVCEERISRDDYLVFRVGRAREGGDGPQNQYFGKLYGPLDVPHKITRVFSLTYYFNPTPNDRNIEYAPRHNLLKGLKPTEEVYDP